MRSRAGIIGLVLLGCALNAHAQSSPYSSMAVVGDAFTNEWSTVPNLTLIADRTWQGIQEITSTDGSFKFAANGTWDISWGGNASIARVPASAVSVLNGSDMRFVGLTPGLYQFTFNDETLEFQMEWADTPPLPALSIASMSLVGDFNNWTPGATQLTNNPANTNLWGGNVDLYVSTTFQFFPDGTWSNQFGATEPSTISITNLNIPITNQACGKFDYTLSDFVPGTFRFELNASNNLFTVTQTATQQPFSVMTALGSFVGTPTPPPNMMKVGATVWQSDHDLTNNGTVTLRFSADYGFRLWGATNTSPAALPVSDVMATGLTAFAQISGVVPGRYRITFNHQTAAYDIQQVYPETDGINLLDNPGFEEGAESNGNAVAWGGWQSWPKAVTNGYLPHSGSWCGAVHGQQFTNWTDYASFAQKVPVIPGLNYRASAWFKVTDGWTASTMQVKIEWLNADGESIGGDAIEPISSLTNIWVQYTAEGIAPPDAIQANVVFLCSGSGTIGTMQVDDTEMRVVSGRTQNFESWGALTNFAAFDPDWSITSGRTLWNVSPGRPPAAVMISQYVEGTGNNKAIEIFNGTLSAIDLGANGYTLQQFNNGSTTPSVSIPLSGTIAAGACLVVGRQDTPTNYAPAGAIGGLNNLLTNKYITFNGDDVIVLRQGTGGPIWDRVGQAGANATGSIWSRNTTDHTLTRKSTIFTGTLSQATADFPLLEEWEISETDDFTDLGTHEVSFLDPNEPYTPGGYSLIMDSGATLMSGDLPEGIGDVSFWFRTESMTPEVTLVVETAASETGPWTNAATLTDVASSNFSYYAISVNRGNHPYVRFKQTDAGTNRFRIDEITVTEPSDVVRLEDFTGWTDPAFEVPGSYTRFGWSIENGSVSPTSGIYDTRAALISPPDGSVSSPAYELGVGEMVFWAEAEDSGTPAYLQLQTTIDGGTNWVTQEDYTVSAEETYNIWLYLTNNPSQARFIFDPAQDSGNVLLDNIEVRVPALYRDQNFNGWPYKPQYTSGAYFSQGWEINNCIVDAQYPYSGMAARLNQSTSGDAWIESPFLPGGIGSISLRMRKVNTSDANPSVQVQVSPNGSAWSTITTFTATSTDYALFQMYYEDTVNSFVRFVHSSGGSAVPIDDIQIGSPQPRPVISITPDTDPGAPSTNDTVKLTADIVTEYGASILSVTGYYQIASYPWNALPMTTVAFGSYASASSIPALPPSVPVQYYVVAQYAGIGAAPASTGYTTNLTTSITNSYRISAIRQGDVWINELSYLNYDWDFEEDREFIELCGVAGSDISGWSIELALGDDMDIDSNNYQAVYASYPIASHTFTNQTNQFSFFVLGDQQLYDMGEPVDVILDTLVPATVNPWAAADRDHLQNSRGVIRLLNEYGNVVYSLSYEGSASGSDRIPTVQDPDSTNTVSLTGTGSSFDDFIDWEQCTYTIGIINVGQYLIPPGDPELSIVWHIPEFLATPLNTNVPPFTLRDALDAQNQDDLRIHYGYPDPLYTLPSGTLHYRQAGQSWDATAMAFLTGSRDVDTNSYVRGIIPGRTFIRGTAIEYVIEAIAGAGTETTYIGLGTTNEFELFSTLGDAQASPFTYTYAIRSGIFITNMTTEAASWVFNTMGNDVIEPFTNFMVEVNTNALTQYRHVYEGTNIVGFTTNFSWGSWAGTNFTVTPIDAFGQNTFTVPQGSERPKAFYRITPLWP